MAAYPSTPKVATVQVVLNTADPQHAPQHVARFTPSSLILRQTFFGKNLLRARNFVGTFSRERLGPTGSSAYSCALLALRRVHSYPQLSQAPSRSREKVHASLHEWQRGGRRSRRGQSHSEELPLRGRRRPPTARQSAQASSVLLWLAWRPSSLPSSRPPLVTVTPGTHPELHRQWRQM